MIKTRCFFLERKLQAVWFFTFLRRVELFFWACLFCEEFFCSFVALNQNFSYRGSWHGFFSLFFNMRNVFFAKMKKHTALTIPVWSPTTVLGEPNPAWLRSSDGIRYIQGGMTVWWMWWSFKLLMIKTRFFFGKKNFRLFDFWFPQKSEVVFLGLSFLCRIFLFVRWNKTFLTEEGGVFSSFIWEHCFFFKKWKNIQHSRFPCGPPPQY